MPGTRDGCPASSCDQPAVDDVPVALRVAVFGAALAAALTRVVARFGAGVLAMVVPAVRRLDFSGCEKAFCSR